jgi:hypothetical protein
MTDDTSRRKTRWTTLRPILPIVLAAALAWVGSIIAITMTARYQATAAEQDSAARVALQKREDAAQFRLAAAELVMKQATCLQALYHAALLQALFPNDLNNANFIAPVQLVSGNYEFVAKTRTYVPLRDSRGCTGHKSIPGSTVSTLRKLFGTDRGSFRTKGLYAAARVRG